MPLWVACFTCVEVSVTATDALGTMAPVASMMVPWMLAVPAIWAFAFAANNKMATQKKTANQRLTIPCGLKHGYCIVASNRMLNVNRPWPVLETIKNHILVIEDLAQIVEDRFCRSNLLRQIYIEVRPRLSREFNIDAEDRIQRLCCGVQHYNYQHLTMNKQ